MCYVPIMLVSLLTITVLASQPTLLSHTSSDLSERSLWNPTLGLSCNANISIQLINLLKRQALGLVDEEVHEGDADETAAEPDPKDLGLQIGVLAWAVVDEIWCRVGDGEIEQPVCGSCHGKCLRAKLKGENLARHYPCNWALEDNISIFEIDEKGGNRTQVDAKKKM